MTLFVWLLSKLKMKKSGVWIAIALSTLLFGLGHLPATAAFVTLTPLIIARAIVLNGIGGVVFGWLYWKKGLESAMIAHFSADIILHVLFQL
jgi:membrane protease YdiL (CAAX protease family)